MSRQTIWSRFRKNELTASRNLFCRSLNAASRPLPKDTSRNSIFFMHSFPLPDHFICLLENFPQRRNTRLKIWYTSRHPSTTLNEFSPLVCYFLEFHFRYGLPVPTFHFITVAVDNASTLFHFVLIEVTFLSDRTRLCSSKISKMFPIIEQIFSRPGM